MLRRFSSNRFRLSDGFKSGEIVRLNSVQRRSRGCQARFRPLRASSVRLRLRSRGAFARPAFVRGGFPPPEVPGSFSRSRLLFRFVAVQLVHVRYLDGSFKFKIGCSICRSPLDPPRSPGGRRFRRLCPVPADRSPGPFRSRPLVSSVSVQFVSFRPFVARSSSLAVPFTVCSVHSCLLVLVFPACSARSSVLFVFLVPSCSFSPGFDSVSFSSFSCSFELVLCSRLLACRFYLYYSRVYYTLKERKGK